MADGEKIILINIEEEMKAYLTTEYGFLEYLQPWAARRVHRESWGRSVTEQVQRPEQEPLKQDVAASFRAILGEIDRVPHLEEDDRESVRVRVLRGIKFFGGETNSEEEELLRQYRGKQLDLLANEGFQLQ